VKKEKNLTRKLKHLKITMSEQVVNELVNFFKLKTSLDLFYRGNRCHWKSTTQGLRSTKAIVSLIFQNKMKRSPSTADEDIHKPTISSNYDMLVLAKNTINWIIVIALLQPHTWRWRIWICNYQRRNKSTQKIVRTRWACSPTMRTDYDSQMDWLARRIQSHY
jgi:hypothetical protein